MPHYFVGSLAVIGTFSALFSTQMLILIKTAVNCFQIQDFSVAEVFCKVGFPSGYVWVVNALNLWLLVFDRHNCVVRPFNRRVNYDEKREENHCSDLDLSVNNCPPRYID